MKVGLFCATFLLFSCNWIPSHSTDVRKTDEDRAIERIFDLISDLTSDGTIRNVSHHSIRLVKLIL